ncbi:MAG: Na/Pi cotransporter family protein [Sandaracinaceae bacterium]
MQLWPLIAGLGLFLFGMTQLEGALKELAGDSFRGLLRRYSSTPLKGIAVGAGTTMVLQSSSLVMVLVLAFVGAGLVDLRGALGVVYGANLGTTMTGWLVATLGFKLDLGSASLGLLGVGGIGTALLPEGRMRLGARLLIGLGLILLGLDQMKEGVDAWAASVDVTPFVQLDRVTLSLVGLAITAVIQSSSATMMIALSALHGGILTLPAAAAIAIGSNVGSTLTGVLGSLGGTPDKKRVAAAHVLFNAVTAVAALVLFDPMLFVIGRVGDPVVALALFHTVFNVMGIALFLPVTRPFADFLGRRFVVSPERIGRFIHRVEPTVVEAALAALDRETRRAVRLAIGLNHETLRLENPTSSAWRGGSEEEPLAHLPYLDRYQQLKRLKGEIIAYAAQLQKHGLEPAETLRLNQLLGAVRDAVLSAKAIKDVREDLVIGRDRDRPRSHPREALHAQVESFYRTVDGLEPGKERSLLVEDLAHLRAGLRDHHQQVLEGLYRNAAEDGLDQAELSTLLNLNRALRRSGRGLLRALTAYLLGPGEAQVLEETEG